MQGLYWAQSYWKSKPPTTCTDRPGVLSSDWLSCRYETYWREIRRENASVVAKSKTVEQRLVGVYEYWYSTHGSWNRLLTELQALPQLNQALQATTDNIGLYTFLLSNEASLTI
jgi:hypothetical protein